MKMATTSTSTAPPYPSTELSSSSESQSDIEVIEDTKESGTSLLDRLKSPSPGSISRPRKILTNKPPKGKCRCRGSLSSDPKKISPTQRIREYETEPFCVQQGHLFCTGCREQLSLKRSIISNHIKSGKHEKGKKSLEEKEFREKNIAECLKKYNEKSHSVGETLPEQQQVYRVKVVSAFLKAGVPLNKISLFHDILEEKAFRLGDRRSMQDYVPE